MKLATFILCLLVIVDIVVGALLCIVFGSSLALILKETLKAYLDTFTESLLDSLWIIGILILIPLVYIIPMTLHVYKAYKGEKELSLAFKICLLLFVSIIGGILLLLDDELKKSNLFNKAAKETNSTNNVNVDNEGVVIDNPPDDKGTNNNP